MPETFFLTLPWPPSVNHLWRRSRRGVFKTRTARDYEQLVWAAWQEAGRPRITDGDLAVTIVATPPDRRRRDLDNLVKAVLDALVRAGAMSDDSHVAELHVERRDPRPEAPCIAVTAERIGGGHAR